MKAPNLYVAGAVFSLLISVSISQAGEELTGEQITQLLSGKTVEGAASSDIFFTKTYNADGNYTLEFKNDFKPDTGTWWVVDNKYCQSTNNKEKCYTLEKDAQGYLMRDKGDGEIHTRFQIIQ